MKFEKAARKKAKLRLALTGPSGSGKTHGALLIAKGIGGKIAVVDTEKGSASLYTHLAEFDALDLAPPFTPERFIGAVRTAEQAGYNILIIDSITHEWSGSGGCLEINDQLAKAKYKGNTWSAWNETTPRHRAFLDAILHSPLHIIATMRSKTETAQTEDGGRKRIVKLGMKAEQRDGSEYEFTTVLDIVHEGHYAVASKDRTGLFTDKEPQVISTKTGEVLKEWLETGVEAAQEPAPEAPVVEAPKGTITPTTGVWDELTVDQQIMLQEIVDGVRAELDRHGATAAAKLWSDETMLLSVEEKAGAWTRFDSRERSAMKKANAASNQEKEAA